MLQLMDTYCGGWAILVIGLTECIAIAWVYGEYSRSYVISVNEKKSNVQKCIT